MRKLLGLFLLLPMSLLACSPGQNSTGSGGTGGTGTTTTSDTSSSSSSAKTDDEYRAEAVKGMHDALLADIQQMHQSAIDIQNAVPTPPDRGWDAKLDAAAIGDAKKAWLSARTAYEHVEGALAPLFPDLDISIDARYDDFMTLLQAKGGDKDLFDDQGVTGMHAIERILYSDSTPPHVVDFEKTLPGYVAAQFPPDAASAAEMKAKLCGKFVSDSQELVDQWTPANINPAIAFQGLIALVKEQREKVQKASSDEEESRYSQRTMADLRDNLLGSRAVYALFQPWILSKTDAGDPSKDGPSIDKKILAGFDKLDAAYKAVSGDAIPQPPATWSAENPSPADLMTPFGKLYQEVQGAVDPTMPDSVVSQLNDAAKLLGFPEFNGK
jgi:iron uptake system component EfeO